MYKYSNYWQYKHRRPQIQIPPQPRTRPSFRQQFFVNADLHWSKKYYLCVELD